MATKANRKRKKPEEEYLDYLVENPEWSYSYSLSPDDGRHLFGRGFYNEFQNLKLKGVLKRPRGFRYPNCEITLSGQHNLLDEEYERPLRGVGHYTGRDDTLDFYVQVQAERISEFLILATQGKIERVSFWCTKMRYRTGVIRSFHINPEAEEDEEE